MGKSIEDITIRAKLVLRDNVSNYLYYDRKEDDDFSLADVDEMYEHPEIIEELVEEFRKRLQNAFTAI